MVPRDKTYCSCGLCLLWKQILHWGTIYMYLLVSFYLFYNCILTPIEPREMYLYVYVNVCPFQSCDGIYYSTSDSSVQQRFILSRFCYSRIFLKCVVYVSVFMVYATKCQRTHNSPTKPITYYLFYARVVMELSAILLTVQSISLSREGRGGDGGGERQTVNNGECIST